MPIIDSRRNSDSVVDAVRSELPAEYTSTPLAQVPEKEVLNAWEKLHSEIYTNRTISQQTRDMILNIALMAQGGGGYFNRLQTVLSCLDQHPGSSMIEPPAENYGITFITRPKLCLRSSNLRNTRTMIPLDTTNNMSIAFMIRALLDTNLINANSGYSDLVKSCPLIDYQNPFLTPLCNRLTSFNGAPDIALQTMTTDGGYMSEAQTFVIGGDNLMRSGYQFSCSFSDILFSPIFAILYYWIEYIRCVTRGIMLAYPEDIDQQIINYTVSFYRFLLDPTRRYITKWAKLTGCFPTALPIGGMFNFSENQYTSSASRELGVNFIANRVEYMDYAILMDFNKLVQRYCPNINQEASGGGFHEPNSNGSQRSSLMHPNLPKSPFSNFRGLPYITSDRNGIRLEYRTVSNQAFFRDSPNNTIMQSLLCHEMHQSMGWMKNKNLVNDTHYYYTPETAEEAALSPSDVLKVFEAMKAEENRK